MLGVYDNIKGKEISEVSRHIHTDKQSRTSGGHGWSLNISSRTEMV